VQARQRLHSAVANTRTTHKPLIPSVLARYEPPVKHNSSEYRFGIFASDFLFIEWDKMVAGGMSGELENCMNSAVL